jgi:hypothetical protein
MEGYPFSPPRQSIAAGCTNSAPKHFFPRFSIQLSRKSKDQTYPFSQYYSTTSSLPWRQIQRFPRLQKSVNPGKRSGLPQTSNLNSLSPASDLRRTRKSSWTELRFSLLQQLPKTRRLRYLLLQNKDARTKGHILPWYLKIVIGQLAPAYYGIVPCPMRCISITYRHVLKASQHRFAIPSLFIASSTHFQHSLCMQIWSFQLERC